MIDVLDLNSQDDIKKLQEFSLLDHPPTFRYFKNRIFEEAIKTHIVTLMYSTYGYAHIDKDIESGTYYLGICVMPEHQGKGIGKKLLDMLFKLHKDDIYLTVDKQNISAISLYEKYHFKQICQTETSYKYKRSKKLLLEISIGEAIDKLTILDIKLEKIINTNKKLHCQREFDSIHIDLVEYIDKVPKFYKWLRYINLQIWNLQDEMREENKYSNEIFHKILDLNDMRFRVKKKINNVFETSFQEQKGYSNKTGIFLTHLGLGDLINMNGAIRYCALIVDKLYVICKSRNCKNVREMFSDDPTIHIIECRDDESDVKNIISNKKITSRTIFRAKLTQYVPYFEEHITHRFVSGVWCGRTACDDIPNDFYRDLKLAFEIKHIFAIFNSSEYLPLPNIPYIFTHSSSSDNVVLSFETKLDINTILTIDPNKNYYHSQHKWFTIAENYVNKPFLSYVRVIENAKEIHVTDSSFFCMCCFLRTKADKRICYNRITGNVSRDYFFT
jgi:GNAT superfamily N-acetyltransferase